MTQTLVLVHGAATLFLCGVIWFVQVVHYPLFANVGTDTFPAFERRHSGLATFVVAPAMLVESGAAVALIWWAPAGASILLAGAGLALLGVIWLSTFLVQVPCHRALERGVGAGTHRRLVASNWIRTVAWSARGVIALLLL